MKHGVHTRFSRCFPSLFPTRKRAKNLKKFKVLFLHARVRIRVIFLYRAETPCRTLGIKIIITLEIGHGTPRNLRWPYAGWNEARRTWKKEKERRRGEEEKKKNTIAYLIWHYGTGLGRLTLFNRGCSVRYGLEFWRKTNGKGARCWG